ncbi:MAG: redoxin domain-containing protein [Bacteroidetes bacterium]|nr:redoxin domain-containing protein [Bacteroidota bacterium]
MKNLKFILFFSVIIFGAISLAFTSDEGYQVGDPVEDFSLKNTDGNFVSLAGLKNTKGAIVIFTCNHCPYSKLYEQRIQDLDKMYASKGFPVVAINPTDPEMNPDDSFEEMVKRAKEKKYSFPYLVDEGQMVFPKFGANRTPHAFVLSKKEGKFYVEYIGAIDDNTKDGSKATHHYVEEAVNSLLKGKKPETTFTKAIGCSIKSKK